MYCIIIISCFYDSLTRNNYKSNNNQLFLTLRAKISCFIYENLIKQLLIVVEWWTADTITKVHIHYWPAVKQRSWNSMSTAGLFAILVRVVSSTLVGIRWMGRGLSPASSPAENLTSDFRRGMTVISSPVHVIVTVSDIQTESTITLFYLLYYPVDNQVCKS